MAFLHEDNYVGDQLITKTLFSLVPKLVEWLGQLKKDFHLLYYILLNLLLDKKNGFFIT